MPIKCPCCRNRVEADKLKKTGTLIPFDGFPLPVGGDMSKIEAFMYAAGRYAGVFQWACDDCIQQGKAILSRPSKQSYTFSYPWDTAIPYLAYFDQDRRCENCGKEYIFSKEEQRHWYEELKFVVYAQNVRCPECRKSERHARNLNTELSELLKDGRPEDPDQLDRIAELYKLMNKPEKEKAYSRAAQQLRKKSQ